MIKKKILLVSVVTIIITMLFGCTSEKVENDQLKKNSIAAEFSVGMITDDGGTNDAAFNYGATVGLQKAREDLGVKVYSVQAQNPEAYEKTIMETTKSNELIFAVGFRMKEALETVAKDNSKKDFVIIDDVSEMPNIKSVTFKEEEGAFLMGVIAGKMTNSNKVAFIGGLDMPIIQKFESGFAAGVKSVNELASDGLINKKMVRYTSSFSETNKGYDLARGLYEEGVDIIFHASGAEGIGVFKAAKEDGRYALGVDLDQSVLLDDYKDVILSSMVKNVDEVVFESINEFVSGTFKPGKNNVLKLGLKDNGVGIAESTKNNVPKDIIDLVDRYKDLIISEAITVPSNSNELNAFKAPEI